MKIVLIRHSKTLVEPQKSIVLWGLSDEGIERAKVLSGNDVIKSIQVMYASHMASVAGSVLMIHVQL